MFASKRRFAVTGDSLSVTNREVAGKSVGSSGRHKETASLTSMLIGGSGKTNANAAVSGPISSVYYLTGIVPDQHEEMLRRYYRDIYHYDHVAGAAVDIISSFPFSRWTLTGLDRKQLEKFDESLFRLNLRSLLPEISMSYLVDAEYIGTLIFNHKDKVFIDILNHNPDECNVERYPFYSIAPKIRVLNSKETRDFMASNSDYARQVRAMFSQEFIRALQSSAYELNPLTTLYLARRTLPSKPPISYLKRILPIYLLEKQLYRGTLVEAHKRQRSMLHVTAGDDNWEPTPEELDALVEMFQQMEIDPLGGVISTRTSVQATEIRQGGDFWKWTDQADILVPYKLRALGISEAFLSADATFSNSETALSVFMENIDQYREFLTYGIFENRLFPIVSYTNEFFKNPEKAVGKVGKLHMMYSINNQQNLKIPKLHWHKRLEAKSEDNMLDTLSTVSEKGLPIPLRMWAAAAKIDMDTLIYELEEDQKYRDALEKLAPNASNDGEAPDEEMARVREISSYLFKHRKVPLLARDYGSASELYGRTKTGKKRHIFNQAEASAKVNAIIAKAAKALDDPHNREQVRRRIVERIGRMPRLL